MIMVTAVISFIFRDQLPSLLTAVNVGSDFIKAERSEAAIYFPDAGNAGCAIVKTPDAAILIDCGREKAQHDIIAVLDDLNIETIDMAVLTHPDSDHIGDFARVSQEKTISSFVTCEYSLAGGNEGYDKLSETLISSGIKCECTHTGDVYTFGDTVITVISPDKIYNDSNDNSVVMKLEYGNHTALFTGDISSKAERDILNSNADIKADILQVPHHGSAGSSTTEFLEAVKPKTAVISAQESRYLPSGEAIARLRECGCEIRRTDEEHGVMITW